jgi:hypothetical protein
MNADAETFKAAKLADQTVIDSTSAGTAFPTSFYLCVQLCPSVVEMHVSG